MVLTKKAIDFLETLQGADNSFLKANCEEINDVISSLIDAYETFDDCKEDQVLIMERIKFMNDLSKNLKRLMKP